MGEYFSGSSDGNKLVLTFAKNGVLMRRYGGGIEHIKVFEFERNFSSIEAGDKYNEALATLHELLDDVAWEIGYRKEGEEK